MIKVHITNEDGSLVLELWIKVLEDVSTLGSLLEGSEYTYDEDEGVLYSYDGSVLYYIAVMEIR